MMFCVFKNYFLFFIFSYFTIVISMADYHKKIEPLSYALHTVRRPLLRKLGLSSVMMAFDTVGLDEMLPSCIFAVSCVDGCSHPHFSLYVWLKIKYN